MWTMTLCVVEMFLSSDVPGSWWCSRFLYLWTERHRCCRCSISEQRPPSCDRSSEPHLGGGNSTETACGQVSRTLLSQIQEKIQKCHFLKKKILFLILNSNFCHFFNIFYTSVQPSPSSHGEDGKRRKEDGSSSPTSKLAPGLGLRTHEDLQKLSGSAGGIPLWNH